MPATDPSPARLTADQALEAAERFAIHGDNVWRQGKAGHLAAATAAAQLSLAFAQIANLKHLRAWEADR